MCEAWSAEGSALELSNVVGEVFAVRECFSAAGAHMLNQHTEHISVSEFRLLLGKNPVCF
jgi:hypothetical protein